MLWRASQAFRHSPLANLPGFFHRGALLRIPRNQVIRCGSAALALQVRAVARQPATTHLRPKSQVAPVGNERSKLPSQRLQNSIAATLPQPDPELVDIVDALYARHSEGDYVIEDLETLVTKPELLNYLRDREKAAELAVLMVNTKVPRRAIHVLLLAHEFGSKFIQNVYERVAYQLAQTRRWEQMPALVALGQQQTGKTTVRLMNWRTRALVEISQYTLLNHVLSDFEEAHIKPNRRTFDTLVTGHLRNHDLEKVQDCLEWMQDAGFPMDASTHAMLASGYRALGPDRKMEQKALTYLPRMSARDGAAAVNGLLQVAVDTDDSSSVHRFVALFDLPSSERSGGPSTSRRGSLPHMASSHSIPAARPGNRLYPDVATFTILVNYGTKKNDYAFAMRMAERMKSYGIEPDSYFAAALIRLHGFTGHFRTALDISATLCRNTPSALRHLRVLGWQGGLYSDLVQPLVSHTSQTVNALLRVALRNTGLGSMRIIDRFMRALGLSQNEHTVESLVWYISRTRRIPPKKLARVLQSFGEDFPPTLRQVNIISAALLQKQRKHTAPGGWDNLAIRARARAKDKASKRGTRRAPLTVPPIPEENRLSALVPSHPSLQWESVIKSLQERGVLPDATTSHLRIRYEGLVASNVKSAQAHLQSMLDHGLHPTKYHYSALIESLCRAGQMNKAKEILRTARDAGLAKDPTMYTIIIRGYAEQTLPREAAGVFQQMVKHDVRPDVAAVDALACAFYVDGKVQRAKMLLTNHWQLFGPFPPALRRASLLKLATEFRKFSDTPKATLAPLYKSTRKRKRKKKRNVRPPVKVTKAGQPLRSNRRWHRGEISVWRPRAARWRVS
ncbi:hypothetical protein BDW22DRAFT_1385778 [Trametopsis cervina]|nr:hypothetical protein BDW22DRAFT_1385778 [Trametopsis cervina]